MTKKESGNNEAKSKLSVICPIAGTVTIILLYIGGSLYCVLNKCGIIEIGLGEIGDFVNPIIAGFALMLLYLAYKTQKEEMKNMTDNMENQLEQVYQQAENAEEQLKLAKLESEIQAFTHFSHQSEVKMKAIICYIQNFFISSLCVENSEDLSKLNEIVFINKLYEDVQKFEATVKTHKKDYPKLEKNKANSLGCPLTNILVHHRAQTQILLDEYIKIYDNLDRQMKNVDKSITRKYKDIIPSQLYKNAYEKISYLHAFIKGNNFFDTDQKKEIVAFSF